MNWMIWNTRGTGTRSFPGLIRNLKKHYQLGFLALLETRCSKENSERRVQQFGFENCALVDAEGYSGGIWCLWDSSIGMVTILERNSQFIHLRVSSNKGVWELTVIYASPQPLVRRALWDQLSRLEASIQGPWLLGGDLNATYLDTERFSVATHKLMHDRDFAQWIDNSCMVDLGFVGPEYTWKRGTSEARLDRCLANEEWLSLFSYTSVVHLPMYKSDHRPLLIRMSYPVHRNKPNRPFRFIAAWVLHENFDTFVQKEWESNRSWEDNISNFTNACLEWNKSVFGHTEARKRMLLRRLDGVNDVVRRTGSTPKLDQLQQELWRELEDVLVQDSLLWAQKARLEWTVFGDRNSRFFQSRANSRKRANRVVALRDDDNNWIHDVSILKEMTTHYFKRLFTEDSNERTKLACRFTYPSLGENFFQECSRGVSVEEIKKALFSMGPLKSPGPDGFNALFYQNQWDIVGSSVVNLVKFIFSNPEAVREINGTLIVLIPKKEPPETAKDLRPISLCNVIYKIVTKVIANRLKPALPSIISPNQCSFVAGRLSSDNIIVAQEVVHSMRSMKSQKKGFMAIKIDLEKAYDRVNWHFLLECLEELNLPVEFRQLIMLCVNSPSMQLLWDGEKADSFEPSRGLRQGDPISPYLFVIIIEKLAHLIQLAINDEEWKPIRLTKNGPPISHLFFADDIILFAEASIEQATVIQNCLNKFCQSSGMVVNAAKTRIFFSKNIHHNRSSEISSILGFSVTNDLGKYLGVSLQHQRVNKDTFVDIVDKVKSRMTNWRVNSLSTAGRCTLVSSISSAIPTYAMQTAFLPATTCEALDKCNRNFLWGSSTEKKKIHLVAWDEVCKPKKKGGLGLRHAQLNNKAFLMKLGWQLISRRDALWVQVVRNKYQCGTDLIPCMDSRKPSSNTWQGIKNVWDKMREGMVVNNNEQVRWKLSKSGDFTVKSAYNLLNEVETHEDPLWNRIWKLKVPERCRMFTWITARQRLLTNASRRIRGICNEDLCPVCHVEVEDQLHVLRDCSITRAMWQILVPCSDHTRFFRSDFMQWFRENLMKKDIMNEEAWGATFVIACWWIWRRRNLFVFEQKKVSNDILIGSIRALVVSVSEAHERFKKGTLSRNLNDNKVLKWLPPGEGQLKVNVDGALSHVTHEAACGGLFRDHNGSFLRGFTCKLMEGDVLSTELWGIVHGLKIAWDMGFRNVIIESDSAEACNLLINDPGELHEDRRLIDEAKSFLIRDWSIMIKHVSRWSNQAADYLAKISLSGDPGFHIITEGDERLKEIILQDMM